MGIVKEREIREIKEESYKIQDLTQAGRLYYCNKPMKYLDKDGLKITPERVTKASEEELLSYIDTKRLAREAMIRAKIAERKA